ncbi:hypothetical protein CASFOL_037085 [Castilleja foliolosa]|uniref:LOB domain-containing protein n=1 Tax=Castilleja foliolosa TaxID=1961234 RepID=A0ABD3BPW3_9LAMI
MNSRCAACKHLRRRCPSDCIFAPYFPSNNPRRFAYVHKIYGASNVGKILQDRPVNLRADAAETLWYEAYLRIKDPVYGCAGIVDSLQQQLYNAQCQLAKVRGEIVALKTQQQIEDTNALHQDVVPNLTSFHDISNWFV